jgi:hypothetical protein
VAWVVPLFLAEQTLPETNTSGMFQDVLSQFTDVAP